MRVTPEDSLAPEMEVETTDGLLQLKAEEVEERDDRDDRGVKPSHESEEPSEFYPNLTRHG